MFDDNQAYSSSFHPWVAPRIVIPSTMMGLHHLLKASRRIVSRNEWDCREYWTPLLNPVSPLDCRRVILEVASQIGRGASTPVVTGYSIGHLMTGGSGGVDSW